MPESLLESRVWKRALQGAADPDRARNFLKQLAAQKRPELQRFKPEQAAILTEFFSGSHALGSVLLKHVDWLTLFEPELLRNPRREQGLRREVSQWLHPALQNRDDVAALAHLRLFHQRELVRIAARDLARLTSAVETTLELSNLADVCLSTVLEICARQLTARFGDPYHQNARDQWQPTRFAIIGLGKLGGQELNYSSDVDLIFLYSEEGHVFKSPPQNTAAIRNAPSSHEYFKRLVEAVVSEATRPAPEGMLYRVDLRLRPEGDAGPLARSLPSYETFYSQWGQTWERMMLIKARGVAGDEALAHEFLEMIQPFRFPRSPPEGALREIAAMKQRMEKEVVRPGELERNVKLGRGGIREIEFIVQSTQLIRGGQIPFLQGPQTLPVLEKMTQYKLIEPRDAQALRDSYCFLRDLENRLQMESNLQTHTLPSQRHARERLAQLMGFKRLAQFDAAHRTHTRNVRTLYLNFLPLDERERDSGFPRTFDDNDELWLEILARHGFQKPSDSLRLLKEFVTGPGFVHVSRRTEELAWQLISKLFQLCPGAQQEAGPSKVLSDPDRVLTRMDSFISAYGARALMFETWNSHPSLFELLLLLFDRSEFLAERAIRNPDLVDELVLSDRLARSKSASEILDDLRHGLSDTDQKLWIRRYHQAEFMRIGLRDILGLADAEQNLAELSALAEACLQYALEVTLRKQKQKSSPISIIGLGKLGGQELTYGSDLDIVFVAKEGVKNLPKLQRVAVEVIDLLSSQTELGIAFATDARLRPDGEKGLLVNTLDSYDEYYRTRAQLWEIQALTRARPVAGNAGLGDQFRDLAATLTNFSDHGSRITHLSRRSFRANADHGLTAYTPDWKTQIARMRHRIEKERTPPGHDALAIKTGSGGLIDAEFIAQTLCLEHGWLEPNTLRALERARREAALPERDAAKLIENFRQLRRIESILRRWSFEGEAELPADAAAFRRVSIRCGFGSPEKFRAAVAACRKSIRLVYAKVFPTRNRE